MPEGQPTSGPRQVEELRARFERDWNRNSPPRIEDTAAKADEPWRAALVKELLRTEIALRRAAGESPAVGEYLERFVDQREWIEQLCAAAPDCTLSIHPDLPPKVIARPGPVGAVPGYELGRELHRGGQGAVYEAWHSATRRRVAVKVLLSGREASEAERRRFEREVDLTAALRHPNIVTLHDSGVTADGAPFLVMELVDGVTLDQHLLAGQIRSLDQAVRLFLQIASAVQYAHQRGVIHRDLKPGNILIDKEGEPRILDFGLARPVAEESVRPEELTVAGQFLGTLAYASPEQVEGDPAKIDIRTDLYSLGVILYRMVTGAHPYPLAGQLGDILRAIAETPPEPPSSLSRRNLKARVQPAPLARIDAVLDAILLKALAKAPAARYQSAGEFATDLGNYLAGEPPFHARPPSMAHLAWRWLRKNVGAAVWAFGIGLLFSFISNAGFAGPPMKELERGFTKASEKFFPSSSPPSLVVSYAFVPDWNPALLAIITMPFNFLIGLAIALIVRPRDVWSDVAAGMTAGAAASLMVFTTIGLGLTVGLGPIIVIEDLVKLTTYEKTEGKDDSPKVSLDLAPFYEKYPDLKQLPANERGPAIMTRILMDLVVGAEHAMWVALDLALLFGFVNCLSQTVIAGVLARIKSTTWFVVLYVFVGIPLTIIVVVLCLAVVVRTSTTGIRELFRPRPASLVPAEAGEPARTGSPTPTETPLRQAPGMDPRRSPRSMNAGQVITAPVSSLTD